ncbi:MAG TPA: hypothetical protein VF807_05100, partial [Ktedonobacterales bacterium]
MSEQRNETEDYAAHVSSISRLERAVVSARQVAWALIGFVVITIAGGMLLIVPASANAIDARLMPGYVIGLFCALFVEGLLLLAAMSDVSSNRRLIRSIRIESQVVKLENEHPELIALTSLMELTTAEREEASSGRSYR